LIQDIPKVCNALDTTTQYLQPRCTFCSSAAATATTTTTSTANYWHNKGWSFAIQDSSRANTHRMTIPQFYSRYWLNISSKVDANPEERTLFRIRVQLRRHIQPVASVELGNRHNTDRFLGLRGVLDKSLESFCHFYSISEFSEDIFPSYEGIFGIV
jgi:hypothetical protein